MLPPLPTPQSPIALLQQFFELETPFIAFNAANFTKYGWDLMHSSINGHSFGTLKGLTAVVGEK